MTEVEQLERADVVAADEDLALVGVVQPDDELEDGALPRAVHTNDHLSNVSLR